MAQISFETARELESNRSQGGNSDFGFFWLGNDGDEAVVRILSDDTSSFKIFTVHEVELATESGTRNRKVSCLRNPQDPTTMCPLCAAEQKSRNAFFIQLIRYVTNADGTISAMPQVWERSLAYASKLKGLIDEYGPLSDCIFKIKRFGAKGSVDTKYEFYFGNPKQYPDTYYPKDESAFAGVNLLNTLIMDKNFDELSYYCNYGSFPQTSTSSQQSSEYTPKAAAPAPPAPTQYAPAPPTQYTPAPQATPQIEYEDRRPVSEATQYVPNPVTPPAGAPQRQAPPVQTNAPAGPPQRATRYY